jgi:hypothetical protein
MNNNYAVINNNYWRLQALILLFKIPMGTQKYLPEIYGQIGHAPSKRFASSGLVYGLHYASCPKNPLGHLNASEDNRIDFHDEAWQAYC